MSATPPEAKSEYSRGEPASRGDFGHSAEPESRHRARPGGLRFWIVAGGLLGALLLLVAEFTTLFKVHVATSSTPVRSVATGSHHSYAMLLIAVCAALLCYAVWRSGSPIGLIGIGLLGLVALLIGLVGDLPDASATGIARVSGHYVEASSTPSAGLYMETLGAVILLIACVCGLLLLGPWPAPRRQRESAL